MYRYFTFSIIFQIYLFLRHPTRFCTVSTWWRQGGERSLRTRALLRSWNPSCRSDIDNREEFWSSKKTFCTASWKCSDHFEHCFLSGRGGIPGLPYNVKPKMCATTLILLLHQIMLTMLLIHRTARFIQKPLILNWKKFLLCFSGQMRFLILPTTLLFMIYWNCNSFCKF